MVRHRIARRRSEKLRQIETLEQKCLLAGDLVAQWEADTLNDSVADGEPVTAWVDSIGSINATSLGSPTLVRGVAGGRSAVRFDATDGMDALEVTTAASPMSNIDDYSLIVVFATDSQELAGDNTGAWFAGSGLVDANTIGFGQDWGLTITGDGSIGAGMGAGFGANTTSIFSNNSGFNDGELHIAALTRSGGQLDLYVDDVLQASTSAAPTASRSPSAMRIGATTSGSLGLNGDIAEVRIYDGQLSRAELSARFTEIESHYNNAQPVAQPDEFSFIEDADFFTGFVEAPGVLANDTDADGDPLTAVLVDDVEHGVLSLRPDGSFFYDSDENYFGTDQFTYAANDFRNSDPVTVSITVTQVYDAPTAVADQYKMLSGTILEVPSSIGVLQNDENPDLRELQAAVTDTPPGSLTLNADGSFTYDPQGFAGLATFEYALLDGTGNAAPMATVSIIVNSPPEARDDRFTLAEDSPLTLGVADGILANDFDAENDQLTVSLISAPTNGELAIQANGELTYTPNADYFGEDEFTYQLSDGEDLSNVATARLTIEARNDAPATNDDTYFTLLNEPVSIGASRGVLANDTDIEADELEAQLVGAPTNGAVVFQSDGSFTYTPANDFLGVDTFTYQATDGSALSELTTVSIAINSLEQQQQVVINEIHVHPEIKTERIEFIELYNRGDAPVNLAGWSLRDAVDFVFPDDASLDPGGYLVITQNPTDLGVKYGINALGPWAGKLSNEGDNVELRTANGDLIDEVDYQLGFPWPTYGDEPGPSIQLIHPDFQNDLGGNWRGDLPTPLAPNSIKADNAAPQMRRVRHTPERPTSNDAVKLTATVTDPDGVQSVVLSYQLVSAGDYIADTDPRYDTGWVDVAMNDAGQDGDEMAGDNIYTATLPAELQTHRRLVRYRVSATDGLGASVTGPYADDPVPNFAYFVYDGTPSWTGAARPGQTDPVTYDSDLLDSVATYHLLTTRDSHLDSQYIPDATIRSPYRGSDYRWNGTLVYEGEVYDHINFRARGGVWRYAMGKNMWKFDFPRGHKFQARDDYGESYDTAWDKLNFSSIIQQGNFEHRGEQGLFESVGFELFDKAGTESPNTHYVHFRIIADADENGADQYGGDFQGLYLAIEQPDGNFLDEHDLPDGNFYKIESWNAESTANQGPDQVDDQSDIEDDFIDQFRGNRRPDVEWWRENLDMDRFFSYQAIAHGIHHYDTAFGKNYYYYVNPETDLVQLHPWDLDLTWANNMFGNENHDLNVRVARNSDFNEYTLPANIDLNNRFNAEYQNRVREVLDLLYNPEQAGMLIDERAAIVYQPGEASFVDADRAMWDYNPVIAESTRYTDNNKNGVNWKYYAKAPTRDFAGMIKIMKDYVVDRNEWLYDRVLTNEENIPNTPTVSYTGDAFALDDLSFETSAFASPIGAQFAGMEWRIAETTDPNAEGFDPYDRTQSRIYEIDSLWESGLITEFDRSITIPSHNLDDGKTYRVRVRMLDNDGHWSHWSDPVQFVSTPGGNGDVISSLRITEINYNPGAASGAEAAAGYGNDDFEFIELENVGSQTIDLTDVRLERVPIVDDNNEGVEFAFADGAITQLAAGAKVIVVEDAEAFALRYGEGLPVAGEWNGRLSNSDETLTLTSAGAIVQQFAYSELWHPETDGNGRTLEIIDAANPDLSAWAAAAGWRASETDGGSPGDSATSEIPGDANRDGIFDSTDLVQVFSRGQYEDGIPGNSGWEDGDWNGDGDFDSSDLVTAFAFGAYIREANPGELGAVAIDEVFDDNNDLF